MASAMSNFMVWGYGKFADFLAGKYLTAYPNRPLQIDISWPAT